MTKTPAQKNTKEYKGFALLFAVLAASALIAIGVSIASIALQQLDITTSEQDSQIAYYAADSAEECALYWDVKVGSFPTCLTSSGCTAANSSTSTDNTIMCNGVPIALNFTGPTNGSTYSYSTSTFFEFSSSPASPNAGISITKTFIAGSPNVIQTTLIAQGNNTGIIGRRVERGISEVYNSQ